MSVSPEIISLWRAYLAEEKKGVRSHALTLLDHFIGCLRTQSEADWQSWAVDLSKEIADNDGDVPVRMPLFRQVIFPALLSRLNAGSAAAARWLAEFSQLLYQSAECRAELPNNLWTEHGLILEAIRRDPSDLRAKYRLRAILRDRFDYCLHELPSGILYALDGATPEQCTELLDELTDYVNLCKEIGAENADTEIISDASYFIPAYRDYIARKSHPSFADYLQAHGRHR